KAHAVPDIGLNLALGQCLRRLGGRERPDFDFVRIKRRIDRQLVPAAGHADERGCTEADDHCNKPFHVPLRILPRACRRTRSHPRNVLMARSFANASGGVPWKMISPRSTT